MSSPPRWLLLVSQSLSVVEAPQQTPYCRFWYQDRDYYFYSCVAKTPFSNSTVASAQNFEFFGINESGPEFGESVIPGTLNVHYVWPNLSTIDVRSQGNKGLRSRTDRSKIFVNAGMNTIRINYLMERLTPNVLTGPLDPTYLGDLKKVRCGQGRRFVPLMNDIHVRIDR